ncbi:MAG TPA: NAD(+) diphosphatase [Syntrophales bacterium]|nr:NAD(+) diphosphatase [Syntrophales bacterium]
MKNRLIPSVEAPPEKLEPAWWFVFVSDKMMVAEVDEKISVPYFTNPAELALEPIREWYLGTFGGCHCYCAEIIENASVPDKMAFRGLRYLYGRLEGPVHRIAMKAMHMIEWDRTTRYCGHCGMETIRARGMIAKECPCCELLLFPRISPAIIVLVERENKVLLARVKRFTSELYSVLAGFVEPGETLEEAVQREIEEEVGIRVKNISYFGSQPWPFPDSLMIGFTAEYESGEIKIDEREIADAGWFDPERLPTIPGKISIARELIDRFVETRSREKGITLRKERIYNPNE